ncbi:MAG TPA: hypothetical protein VI260_35295 [Blastocatellia bacterium]
MTNPAFERPGNDQSSLRRLGDIIVLTNPAFERPGNDQSSLRRLGDKDRR